MNAGLEDIGLSDYRGKRVVRCFSCPGDFTFVRPTELTAVAVKYPELQETGVEILSISTNGRFSQGTDSPEFGHASRAATGLPASCYFLT